MRRSVIATRDPAVRGLPTHKSPKSLMRMLGPAGNPQARNLFEVIGYLQEHERVRLKTRAAHR